MRWLSQCESMTVHAPQPPSAQPSFVPVKPTPARGNGKGASETLNKQMMITVSSGHSTTKKDNKLAIMSNRRFRCDCELLTEKAHSLHSLVRRRY